MNRMLLICLFAATVAFGEETNPTITVDGVTYQNVRFRSTNAVSVTVFHSRGVATIPLEKLSPDLQQQLGYDPQRAAQWKAAQQKAAIEAADAQKKAAEQQRLAAASVEWKLTVERVLADGVVARGCKTSEYCQLPMAIFLVDHPQFNELAEGSKIVVTAYRDGVAAVDSRTLEKWVYYQVGAAQHKSQEPSAPSPSATTGPTQQRPSAVPPADAYVPELRTTGAFGFPQADAKVLCNRPTLRLSVWSNNQYFFAQAVLWTDNDSSVGKDADGGALGDYSQLALDLDDNGKETPDLDREYRLNQRPYVPGLRYAICKGNGATSGDKSDSEGRGAIRYVEADTGKRVRVDTYLIPLPEISRHVGDKIGICFVAYSPKPRLSINSVTFDNYRPYNKYSEYVLTNGGNIDAIKVPEGRNDPVSTQ